MDSGTPFPGVRLATLGPPTARLRTEGPPRHGGREIREAPPPSRRPGPRGVGERTSLWAPFTLLCLHPHSLEPWRGETGPRCQHTGCLCVHRSTGSRHPALHGFGSESSGCWWTELQRPSSPPQRTHSTPRGRGDCWLLLWSSLGPAGLDPHPRECRAFSACVRVAVSVYLYVCHSSRSSLVYGAAGLCMLE